MLFIRETFLDYKLETFKNCKEVKYIMIVIILAYVIFDQQLKNLLTPLIKFAPPFLLTSP